MTSSGAYVGRVGGLAVALGIGAAIATGQGVASADSPEPSGTSESPKSPPSSSDGPAVGGPPAAAPGGSTERRHFSVPSFGPSDRQARRQSLVERVESRRNENLSTHDETKSEERNGEAVEDEKLTVADDSVVRRKRRLEASNVAAGIPATVLRSALPSRQSIDDAVERRRNQHETVDRDIDAQAPIKAFTSVEPQLSSFSMPSPSTKVLDNQPVIAQAAPAAAKEPTFISRLLAPLGIGALATTDTPIAPVSPSTLMGALELVRRELDRIFVNETPSFTYDPSTNIVANGAITGKVTPVDADSTDFTYTAVSPAEGDVVIDSDGNFSFTPNANYNPTTGASFAVTISDEDSDFHIHGLSGLLNAVTFGLIGESGHTHTEIVTVGGVVPPSDFQRTVVVSGLNEPTDFRFLPPIDPTDQNEPDRILFAEKGGAIKAYNGSEMQDDPVLTIPVDTDWARGINGVEVDPDFNSNGYIYVSYIGDDNIERLSRFTVTNPTADVLIADPTTEKVLLEGDTPAGDDHHGGEIRYVDEGVLGDRSDDKIYWTTGDNVCCSVVNGSNSQDLSNIYGKVLRINPDGTIPTDNPYYDDDTPGVRKEIYATGLRNPFRGGLTPDGQLIIGDVGQNTWEEINLVTAGANFGWPSAEGVCPGPGICESGSENTTDPIYAYQHEGDHGSSITSVLVYDGDGFGEQYDNAVFFADHNQQLVKVMKCDAGYTKCGAPTTVISQAGGTTRLLQAPDGSIYQLTIDGTLWRIAPPTTETSTV